MSLSKAKNLQFLRPCKAHNPEIPRRFSRFASKLLGMTCCTTCFEAYRLPEKKTEREALHLQIGQDGSRLDLSELVGCCRDLGKRKALGTYS